MKATKFFTLLLLLSLVQLGFSQTKLYLGFDANCMDRYEYHYNNNPTGNAHIAYHIILNDREKVVLEVGIESRINQARPKDVKTCGKFSINERMVRKINNGESQLFIVKKNGNGYNVSEVGRASYAQISPASISVSSKNSRFAYKYSQPANGKNIATNGSQASVYFDGVISHDCPKQYQFNEERVRGGRNYMEWVMIPEIGIVQEKKGFNQTDAENNVLNLTHVNGIPVDRYLDDFCRSVDLDFYSGKFYDGSESKDFVVGGEVASDDSWEDNNNNSTGSVVTNRPRPNTGTGIGTTTGRCGHIYKDLDRNLYYDFNTGQPANTSCGGLTYQNGVMLGTGIQVVETSPSTSPNTGSTVVVTEPGAPSTPPVRTNFCNEESRYGYHIVQRNETLFSIARLYGLSVGQIRLWNGLSGDRIYPCAKLLTVDPRSSKVNPTSVVVSEKGGEASYHVVRKNETLYQLAKTYGYTVDRFRVMNGLSKTDMIYVGQRLKVSECNCPNPRAATTDIIAYAPAAENQVVAYETGSVPTEYNMVGTERLVAAGTESRVEYTDGKKRRFHIVKEDDNIFQISKKYGIDVAQLRAINELEENEVIIPYQRIYLDY